MFSRPSTLMNNIDKKYTLNIFCLEWEGEGSVEGEVGRKESDKINWIHTKKKRKEEKKHFFTVDRRTERLPSKLQIIVGVSPVSVLSQLS